jgi:hypothetical protein
MRVRHLIGVTDGRTADEEAQGEVAKEEAHEIWQTIGHGTEERHERGERKVNENPIESRRF